MEASQDSSGLITHERPAGLDSQPEEKYEDLEGGRLVGEGDNKESRIKKLLRSRHVVQRNNSTVKSSDALDADAGTAGKVVGDSLLDDTNEGSENSGDYDDAASVRDGHSEHKKRS